MAWHKIVLKPFSWYNRGISQLSLIFSWYTHSPEVYTPKRCITSRSSKSTVLYLYFGYNKAIKNTFISFYSSFISQSMYNTIAVCRPTNGRQTADRRPTNGRQSANKRPTDGQQSADRRPTVGQQTADSWPTVGRQVFWGALLHNYQ